MKKLLIILFLLPKILFAQITASDPIAGVASTAQASSYAMSAFTPTAQSLLVVFVFATGTVAAAPTMTGGSLTWTREASQTIGANSLHIFWARVGGSPVSTTITFDCTGDAGTGAVMSVIQFLGYDQIVINPIRQLRQNTATTTSTNANITFPSALVTTNGYAAAFYGGLAANSSTPPTGWTEADDIAYSTPSTNQGVAYRAGGLTTAGAFAWTNASTTWQVQGVEVYASGAGPGTKNFFKPHK